MDTTTIDIQGTFDVAKGRNALRKFINSNQWSPNFNARASVALTALGEFILCSGAENSIIQVQVYILDGEDDTGIEMNCCVPITNNNSDMLEDAQQRMMRAADHVFIQPGGTMWQIALQIWGAN